MSILLRPFFCATLLYKPQKIALQALECRLPPCRRHRGRKPIWGQAILRRYIRPVAQRAGIQKQFGWHTFRHTYSTLLRSVGTEFKVMQELLRHSSFRSTLDVYTQAISPAKHAAQAAVLDLVFASETNRTASA